MQAFKITPHTRYVELDINVFANIYHWTVEEQKECSRRIIKQVRKYFNWLEEEDAMMDSLLAVQKAYRRYGDSLTPQNVFGYVRKELGTKCLVKQRIVNAKAMRDVKKDYDADKEKEKNNIACTVQINNYDIDYLEIDDSETDIERAIFLMDMKSLLPQNLYDVFEKKILENETLSSDEKKLYKEAISVVKTRYYD